MITKETLKQEIKKLLSGADLNAVTSKKVRRDLEQRLGADLSDRKKEIDELIASVLEAAEEAGGGSDNESDSSSSGGGGGQPERPAAKAKSPKKSPTKLPTPGASAAANGDANNSSSSSSSDDDVEGVCVGGGRLTDEQLARQLHERENRLPRRRAAAAAGASGSSKAKRRRSEPPAAGGQQKRRQSSAFSRPCVLSDVLAGVVGCDSMPRQQVVKRLWEIAKDREMFDPKNKQYILCDDEFERLFGRKRVRMFGAMKYLKSHIRSIEDDA